MPPVYVINWETVNVVNSDMSISIKTYNNNDIFSSLIRADSSCFFYSISYNFWGDLTNANNSDRIKVYTNSNWVKTDSSPSIKIYSVRAQDNVYGQLHVSTANSVVLSKIDSSVYTSNSVFIDRTGKYILDSTIYFTQSNVDLLYPDRIISPSYAYQDPTYPTFLGRTLPDPTGIFRVYRDSTVNIVGSVAGKLNIDITTGSDKCINSVYIYMDTTLGDSTGKYYIGEITGKLIEEGGNKLSFDLPDSLTISLGDCKFRGASVYIRHDAIYVSGEKIADQSSSEYLLYDVYLTATATSESDTHTINSATVADATIPIVSSVIYTTNHARIHKGNSYVFDYYTPNNFYRYIPRSYFSYEDWNLFETALNDIGRYYHTPILFNEELPEFGTIKIVADSTYGNVSLVEDYLGTDPDISKSYTGFKVNPEVANYLRLYGACITPSIINSDGTSFKLIPTVVDTTICINIFMYSGKKFYPWSSITRWHPFSTDTTLSMTFFGKK